MFRKIPRDLNSTILRHPQINETNPKFTETGLKLHEQSFEIISKFLLPIGLYLKEAQESRNKDNKQFRLHH